MLATVSAAMIDEVPVARIHGEVDASNARVLRARLVQEVPNTAMGMVLDLTGTDYLDSSGVQMLFEVADALRRRQQGLRLVVAPDSFVADVMDAVDMGEFAVRCATIPDALADLKAG